MPISVPATPAEIAQAPTRCSPAAHAFTPMNDRDRAERDVQDQQRDESDRQRGARLAMRPRAVARRAGPLTGPPPGLVKIGGFAERRRLRAPCR